MSVSSFNRRWAAVILEALTRHGVRHVCIAPGSRSTPLTLAAAENRAFIHHTHFDERGLGHLALGLAKVSKAPVAVIVTSGTAVANLYPALIEAGLTGEKLILLKLFAYYYISCPIIFVSLNCCGVTPVYFLNVR